MANHRPKSLSELNNVYDKAMRAERAIKESSDLLSTPETKPAPQSENIFEQLESKAAQAQKNQVFDPDITNIANDFLKRYAQPEKPKPAPKEIKRPAPSIQVYHTPVKEKEPEISAEAPVSAKPQSTPAHKPAAAMPSTKVVQPIVAAPTAQEPTAPEAPVPQSAPAVKAPSAPKITPKAPARVDHTPRPTPSRARITSTERSELMEEYMRVMSDEDDEPSFRKPKFSFFKKKKKHEEEPDFEPAESFYDDITDDEDSAEEEIPVVPFDDSNVQYVDEYSDSPEDGFITDDDTLPQEPMNIYDYIEADFDYDISDDADASEDGEAEPEEADEEITEEIQEYPPEEIVPEAEEISEIEEAPEEGTYPTEPEEGTYPTEPEEGTYPTEPEEGTYPTDPEEIAEVIEEEIIEDNEEVIYPEEVSEDDISAEEAYVEAEEEIIPVEEETENSEEAQEVIYPEAPTAGMVFEDIFSVTDKSKRSHTGGNWNEVFGEEFTQSIEEEHSEEAVQEIPEAEEIAEIPEEAYAAYEESPAHEPEAMDGYEEEAPQDETEEIAEAAEEAEEESEPVKKNLALKIIMSLGIVLCLAVAGISIYASAFLGVNTGKIYSDNNRAFSVNETVAELGINKGDLVITENVYATADQIYVYADQADSSYKFGKVNATTLNLTGDYLYITQTADGVKLINRDTSMGVVTATYPGIGSVLSVISDYGSFIAIACAIFAIALIICLVIIIRKQRRYEAAAAIYDNPDNFRHDDDDDPDANGGDNSNDEYYSDYDTDGIEQGLFAEL